MLSVRILLYEPSAGADSCANHWQSWVLLGQTLPSFVYLIGVFVVNDADKADNIDDEEDTKKLASPSSNTKEQGVKLASGGG